MTKKPPLTNKRLAENFARAKTKGDISADGGTTVTLPQPRHTLACGLSSDVERMTAGLHSIAIRLKQDMPTHCNELECMLEVIRGIERRSAMLSKAIGDWSITTQRLYAECAQRYVMPSTDKTSVLLVGATKPRVRGRTKC